MINDYSKQKLQWKENLGTTSIFDGIVGHVSKATLRLSVQRGARIHLDIKEG